jgi:hypothetical protein
VSVAPADLHAMPHRGVRHGVVLALAVVVPVSVLVASAAAAGIEGFHGWALVLLASVTTVGAGASGLVRPRPGLPGVAAALVGALLVGLAFRFTVPDPRTAWTEVRDGDAYLVSGTVLVVVVTLAVAAIVGHLAVTRVVDLLRGKETVLAARATDRQVVVAAWGTGLALLVLAGFTRAAAGLLGDLVVIAGVVTGVVVLADVRARIPQPGATRAPIVAAPRSVALAGTALVLGVVVVVVAVVLPLLPGSVHDGLGRPSEWLADVAWLDWELPRSPGWSPEGDRAQVEGAEEIEPTWQRWVPGLPDGTAPLWLQVLVGGIGLVLLALLLRPDRWGATLRRLWQVLRGGDAEEDPDLEALAPVADLGDAEGRGGRWRDALERWRPRPRDPRHAIVHDYLRVERLLGRDPAAARHLAETPLEHAARLAAEPHPAAAELTDLAALVSRVRYGRTAPGETDASRSRELTQGVERRLRDA